MKLSECTGGTLVVDKRLLEIRKGKSRRIGMVKGVRDNPSGEVIPLVEWADGDLRGVHHEDLMPYVD